MFEKLKLWYWKWFRPSKYWRHQADSLAAAFHAGMENPDPEIEEAVAGAIGTKV